MKASVSLSTLFAAMPAFAQGAESARIALPFGGGSIGAFEVIQFSMFLGVMGAALLSAGWLIRERSRVAAENKELRSKFADLNLVAQRNEALLNLKDQRIVVWDGHSTRAEVVGLLPDDSAAPQDRSTFLAFGRWLRPQSVVALERAIGMLREQARSFDLTVETVNGTLLDVRGRTSGGFAVARFLSLQGVQAERAALQAQNREFSERIELFRRLLDRIDQPVWTRDAGGRVEWVNAAYAQAVDMADASQVISEGRELFGAQARQRLERDRFAEPVLQDQLTAVVHGDRRLFNVTDVSAETGSIGLGFDQTEVQAVREELNRTMKSHAETARTLATGSTTKQTVW